MKQTRVQIAGYETMRSPWRGHVHSVFTRAANVSVPGALFTFITDAAWISEKSILVAEPVLRRLQVGDAVAFDGRHILLHSRPLAAVSGAIAWKMPEIAYAGLATLPVLEELLESRPRPPFSEFLEPSFMRAAVAFCAGKDADFSKVVGAGAGLTPSGDDMLVGYALAVLYCRPARLPDLRALCGPLLEKTTEISRHLLSDALRGKFASPLVSLLVALKRDSGIDTAAETAFRIGSSSGRDGVFGLYHGLRGFQ